MTKIYCCVLVQDYSPSAFEKKLDAEISGLQEQGLEVEVQYDAEKCFTALLVARRPR